MPVVQYAYRSPQMQQELLSSDRVLEQVARRVVWELGPDSASAERAYDRLIVLCAHTFATGTHLSGTALDVITRRFDGEEFDLGGPYLTLSEVTPMESPFVSAAARANRDAVTSVFADEGYYAYPFEFWHYSRDDVYGVLLGLDDRPARHGPVHVDASSGEPTPIAEPATELLPREELLELLDGHLTKARRELGRPTTAGEGST